MLLTRTQKDLLRQSWQRTNKSKGPAGIGVLIFKRIFQINPQIKEMFGFTEIPSSGLAYDKRLCKHASIFIKVINEVVANIDHLETVVSPKLVEYGRHHHQLKLQGIAFQTKYWDDFADSMTEVIIDCTSAGRTRREIIRAWTLLISYIIDQMRHGFHSEIRVGLKKSRDSCLTSDQPPPEKMSQN